jgi:hypothetical protein
VFHLPAARAEVARQSAGDLDPLYATPQAIG